MRLRERNSAFRAFPVMTSRLQLKHHTPIHDNFRLHKRTREDIIFLYCFQMRDAWVMKDVIVFYL